MSKKHKKIFSVLENEYKKISFRWDFALTFLERNKLSLEWGDVVGVAFL